MLSVLVFAWLYINYSNNFSRWLLQQFDYTIEVTSPVYMFLSSAWIAKSISFIKRNNSIRNICYKIRHSTGPWGNLESICTSIIWFCHLMPLWVWKVISCSLKRFYTKPVRMYLYNNSIIWTVKTLTEIGQWLYKLVQYFINCPFRFF